MAELPSDPDSTGMGTGRESISSTPGWVKVFGIIGILLVLLFVILHLTGNGLGHHTVPSNVIKYGVQSP